jgi:hypothetical protein
LFERGPNVLVKSSMLLDAFDVDSDPEVEEEKGPSTLQKELVASCEFSDRRFMCVHLNLSSDVVNSATGVAVPSCESAVVSYSVPSIGAAGALQCSLSTEFRLDACSSTALFCDSVDLDASSAGALLRDSVDTSSSTDEKEPIFDWRLSTFGDFVSVSSTDCRSFIVFQLLCMIGCRRWRRRVVMSVKCCWMQRSSSSEDRMHLHLEHSDFLDQKEQNDIVSGESSLESSS